MIALACANVWGMAQAQNYPVKPVRIINPFSPGGSLDLVARLLAKSLTGDLGQQFIVENRPGAGGTIGVDLVAKAPADGYTLLIVQSSITVNPSLQRKVPYDPVKDFEPISKVSSYMFFVVAHPSLPARSVKELIALAKSKPGLINYASVGVGSGTHLAGELFGHMAGAKLTHIPYKGTGQVMPDLLGGQVALTFGSTTVVPHVKSGKLIALGVTGAKRSPVLPDTPTVDESGLKGFEVTAWNALFAPAGTPQPIVNRLNELTRKNIALAEAKSVMDAQGLDGDTGTAAELGNLVKSEMVKWAGVIKLAGIKPE
ncbi:MAG: tripartite tricarboxylate transporter substrate binding protein [Burkholderiales bacterium]